MTWLLIKDDVNVFSIEIEHVVPISFIRDIDVFYVEIEYEVMISFIDIDSTRVRLQDKNGGFFFFFEKVSRANRQVWTLEFELDQAHRSCCRARCEMSILRRRASP